MATIRNPKRVPQSQAGKTGSGDNLAPGKRPAEPQDRTPLDSGKRGPVSYIGWSAVDGTLDVVVVRQRSHFVLRETGADNQVACFFPDDWTPVVRDLIGRRVVVEGLVHYRANGSPKSLSTPTSIHPVPEPKRPILALRGTLPGISGELSSADYVRQLRTGQAGGSGVLGHVPLHRIPAEPSR